MKVFLLVPLLLLLSGILYTPEAANILCLVGTADHNNPGWSQPLFDALLAKGHNLIVVSTAPEPAKTVDGLMYIHLPNEYDVMQKHFIQPDKGHYQEKRTLMQLLVWYEVQLGSCRALIKSDTMQSRMSQVLTALAATFDLIITDVTNGMDCLLDLVANPNGSPILGISAGKLTPDLINLLQAENTINPAKIPHFISPTPHNMGFWNRVHNHIMFFSAPLVKWYIIRPVLSTIVQPASVYPTLQLALLNTHPSIDYVQNLPPGVVQVAGLHIKSELQPLPNSIQKFADQFIDGIVYIDLPYIDLMYGVGVPATYKMMEDNPNCGFIWNVKKMKKVPKTISNLLTLHVDESLKQDILGQASVKAYINHADSFDVQDAVHFGTPMILLPLKLEEFNNAQRVKERSLGVVVSANGFNLDSLTVALKRILNEYNFTTNLYKAEQKFRTRQVSALDLAVWHAEQLIAEPQLYRNLAQPETNAQNFFVAQSLDVLVIPLFLLIVVLVNFLQLGYYLYLAFFKREEAVKEEDLHAEPPKKLKKNKVKVCKIGEPANKTLLEDSINLQDDEAEMIIDGESRTLIEKKDD
ncbi:UDP-glucosyltransferase 2 [Drosophila bipectinata]|uniref:UDP-glucosyltransferase 2 n=1 Tax=Drosophila bipectinata TaxID=42026 RepID=UPI001C892106|nr:UDP-glucosyltransferase 2 [Drosophila bipectinata]